MRRILASLLVIGHLDTAFAAGSAAEPARQPARRPATPAPAPAPANAKSDKAWPKAVEAFAKALADGDRAALQGLLLDKSQLRHFDGGDAESPARMLERVSRSTLVGQHAYFHPALVIAADIAADFKRATAVPEKVRAAFLIDDETEIKRANATAVQWIAEELDVKPGTPVGVIVLWTPKVPQPMAKDGPENGAAAEGQAPAPAFEPVFVLLRGEEAGPQRFKVNFALYGNPLSGNE